MNISNGNSFGPGAYDDPKARFGFTYRVLGGIKMSIPPRR